MQRGLRTAGTCAWRHAVSIRPLAIHNHDLGCLTSTESTDESHFTDKCVSDLLCAIKLNSASH